MQNKHEQLVELVQQAQSGQTEAYGQLIQQFQDMAVGYSYARLGDFDLAEDAAQEAFIEAYRHLSQLKEAAAFPGWFRRIVFKRCDRLTRGKHAAVVNLTLTEQLADHAPTPAETVAQHDLRALMRWAISKLPATERDVVTLFYISEHTHKEISAFLNVPISTVKSRLFSARKRLKETLILDIQDHLSTQRPSNDSQFTEKVMSLFQATAKDDVNTVKTLLAKEPALAQSIGLEWSSVWHGETPTLHMAVMRGQKEVIDLLLSHGADINERDPTYGWTALLQAMDLGFMPDYAALNMPQFLIDRGAKPDLFVALWDGDDEAIEAFLKANPASVNMPGPNNTLPLCYAYNEKIAQLLLNHGADMFAQMIDKREPMTPLQLLIRQNAKIARYLLDKAEIEIDVFLACALGDSAAVIDAIAANPELTQARIPEGHVLEVGLTLLHLAAQKGQADLVEALLAAGADINAKAAGVKGMTPLHLVVWRGPKRMFDPLPPMEELYLKDGVYRLLPDMPRLLAEQGADLAAKDSDKKLTPLGWAEAKLEDDETDRSEVAKILRTFDKA